MQPRELTKAWIRSRRDPGKPGRAATLEEIAIRPEGDCAIYKPNGEPLAVVLRNWIPKAVTEAARPVLQKLKDATTTNRGIAAGGNREYRKRKDGKVSQTNVAPPVPSSVIGYFDRYPRIPYCRQTAFNAQHPLLFEKAIVPLCWWVAEAFRLHVQERWKVQNELAERTSKDFVIAGTPFTTLTVNHNWQTMMHKDAGDLAEGFSCLTVIRGEDVGLGKYDGCELVLPEFGVGVALRTGDVLLMDAHEWHFNTPFRHETPGYQRISLVLYYREGMAVCGTAAQEQERAKKLRGALDDPRGA